MKPRLLMQSYILLLFIFLILPSNSCFAEGYKISPTEDPTTSSGVYIPRDLEDALVELEKMLPPEIIKDMKDKTEDEMGDYHMSLGMWMRNNWDLWKGGRLSEYFLSIGVSHPDAMSGIILDSYWRKLHDKPLELETLVDSYKVETFLLGDEIIELDSDMQEKLQLEVNKGHQPWRLEPISVAYSALSLIANGVSYENCKLLFEKGNKAFVECRENIIYRILLVKEDSIWSAVVIGKSTNSDSHKEQKYIMIN